MLSNITVATAFVTVLLESIDLTLFRSVKVAKVIVRYKKSYGSYPGLNLTDLSLLDYPDKHLLTLHQFCIPA